MADRSDSNPMREWQQEEVDHAAFEESEAEEAYWERRRYKAGAWGAYDWSPAESPWGVPEDERDMPFDQTGTIVAYPGLTIYLIQPCRLRPEDGTFAVCDPVDGSSLLAFLSLRRAREYLREQARLHPEVPLVIVALHLASPSS
jgi:hypothetical protein